VSTTIDPRDAASDVASPTTRDPFIDFVRGFSLLVVVAWHWCFTIITFRADGPHATNPIGFTQGLWTATWLLQVMPLFFFVGGFANLMAWRRKQASGATVGQFVWGRVKQLAVPALALTLTWTVLGFVVARSLGVTWMGRGVKLVISPLWFIAAYLLIILLFPAFLRLHERFDGLVLVWLAGLAWLVDVTRFRHDGSDFGYVNMILVWGFCHQLGFFYERIVDAGRRMGWLLASAGVLGLSALVYSRAYPGSMVGVPGDKFSNMAPPTMCIICLVIFQAGIAVLIRPWVLRHLEESDRWARFSDVMNRFSMPLFLFHTTGLAIAMYVGRRIGYYHKLRPDLRWWIYRPVSFVGPLICTMPVIYLFGRRWMKTSRRARTT
jgi:hypothetical protein